MLRFFLADLVVDRRIDLVFFLWCTNLCSNRREHRLEDECGNKTLEHDELSLRNRGLPRHPT
ncbi:MAG: hypothetical protein DMF91_16310 [Acidobacteria bacterium]|nr:MAG: hypothetical protein DMF91_16310 [Acidobacteriota bacterium]